MKLITISIVMIILCTMVLGATAPTDSDTSILVHQISEEHKTTRQFIANTVVEKEDKFFNEFMKKADGYQQEFQDMIDSAILKLGALWGGVLLFFVSLNEFLKMKLEKRRYKKLKEALTTDIMKQFAHQAQPVEKPKETEFVNKFSKW